MALIAGAFVTAASLLLMVNMLTAMLTVHLPSGFNFMNITGMTDQGPQFGMPGYEVNLLYIAGLTALVLGGAGALSVDRLLRGRQEASAAATAPERTAAGVA
ncbi:MAG: DoxX family protein [Gemmatimonadales bacterium]|jgi:putative oxidoreductase